VQLDLFGNEEDRMRAERLDATIDALRQRFGNNCVRRATGMSNEAMCSLDIKDENTVHPVGFFQS
jgi:DNA polymerase-4